MVGRKSRARIYTTDQKVHRAEVRVFRTDKRPRGILIFEGADCSGKSTLARHFVERHGARYLHGRIFKNMWRSHVAMVRLALQWADEGIVCIDRLWLSELAYGEVYRGGPAYNLGARCLDRVLMRAGAITVLCSPDDQEFQVKRHAARAARGEEAYRKIQRVVAWYADLARGNAVHPGDGYGAQLIRYQDYAQRPDVFLYDLDRDGHQLDYLCNQLIYRLRQQRKGQLPSALLSTNQNFTGNLTTAKTVLVGDCVSPLVAAYGPRGPRWPMAWHDGLSAATWLNSALHKFGHDETTTVVVNANDEHDSLSELVSRPDLRFVALGKHAVRRLEQLGVRVDAELVHPQYARRFYHDQLDDYAEKLRKAMRCEVVSA